MQGESEDPIQRCFDASYRRLVGQLYGVCGDLSEAEEVVAEAFARAVSRRRAFERMDNPEAWPRTVAVSWGSGCSAAPTGPTTPTNPR